MSNLADMIEEFILRRIAGAGREPAVLKRNELAEELECAPSQISYVISTRFTVDRGFYVESRRGSGGFVRIIRVPARVVVVSEPQQEQRDDVGAESVFRQLARLRAEGVLSAHEAELLAHFYQGGRITEQDRDVILRALLRRLSD